MRILVTGAAGFIGSHLAERLSALGHSIKGVDNLSAFYARSLKQLNVQALQERDIPVLTLDLASDDLSEAVQDVDVVYHLAAQPGLSATSTFETYAHNNITATHRLVQAARQHTRLRAFINISTSSVYGFDATGSEETAPQPASSYGVTKLAAEQLVLAQTREHGFPACSLRLFSVYGPRERPDKVFPVLIRSILEDRPFPLYQGSQDHVRSFTYVGDIVDGLVAVLPRIDVCVGHIFNIGTDTTFTTGDGIRIVEEILGRRAKIDHRPPRTGDQQKTHATIEKARRMLDYNPSTALYQGLAQEVQWYADHVFGKIELS